MEKVEVVEAEQMPAIKEVIDVKPVTEVTTLQIDITEGRVQVYKDKLKAMNDIADEIKDNMTPGVDYGNPVAGQSLPSLLQPGADKINLMYGLRPDYKKIDDPDLNKLDIDKKWVIRTYECQLICRESGKLIATGSGSSNNKEAGNGTRQVWDAIHPVDLMARKRAKVNAVRHIGNLTRVFAQDIESMKTQPITGSKALSIYQKFGMPGANMKPMRDYFSEIAIGEYNSTVPTEEGITSLHLGMTAFNQKQLEAIVNKIGVKFKKKEIKAPQEIWDQVMALKEKAPKVKVKEKKAKSKPKAPAKAKDDLKVDPKAKRNARDYVRRQNGKVEAKEIATKYGVPVELVTEYIEKYTKE